MNIQIEIKTTDKEGRTVKSFSKEIENYKERSDLFSLIKMWIFDVILMLR